MMFHDDVLCDEAPTIKEFLASIGVEEETIPEIEKCFKLKEKM